MKAVTVSSAAWFSAQLPQPVQLLLEHDPIPVTAGQRHPGPGPGRLQQRRQPATMVSIRTEYGSAV
jgi:hypothetical protein